MISEDALRKGLERIDNARSDLLNLVNGTQSPAHSGNGRARPRRKLSGKALKARQNQGRYMGAIRHLNKTQKRQVSKLREEKGYHAAIAAAKKLARA